MCLRLRGWIGAIALLLTAGAAVAQPSRSASPMSGAVTPMSDKGAESGLRNTVDPARPDVLLPASPATRFAPATIDPEAPPPFHVSALKLDGTVSGDLVHFVVDMDVEINRADNAYYDVPLRLSQAHLVEKSYTGPGKEGPAPLAPIAAADADDGLHWRFSGAGTHHLSLKLWVPIKRTGGANSLVLSLPQLPQFFDAQFKLRIPGKRITVRVPKEILLGESKAGADATEIIGSVRGNRLEVAWNESSADIPAISRVSTLMTLKRDADRLVLQGEQTIQRERSSTGEVFVRMPTAGQLSELVSPHVRMHEPATNRPGWRRVVLQETAPDRIDLRWTFDMPFPLAGGRLTLDGLEVAEARVQEGGVQLADFGTHLAIARLSESQLIRRVDVSTPRSPVPIVTAFEFVKQPFSLVLDIQKVQPRYSVRPAHWILIRSDEMLLESAFQIEVENGALGEFSVAWATARAEGWRIDTTSPGLFDLTPVESEAALSTGVVPIRLRSPATGKLEVRLRFRRPLSAPPGGEGAGREIAWSLPRIPTGRALPGLLVVAGDDNVLPRVQPDAQATEETTPNTNLVAPAEFADLPRGTYRLSPRADGTFKARVSLREREVDVGTTISVSREAGRGLLVRQVMHYQVRFGRISTVRVELPEQLASRIPVGSEKAAVSARLAGMPLTPVRAESRLEFSLPAPRIGEFDVTIDYTFPLGTDVSQTVDAEVPILRLPGGTFSSVRCILPDGEGLSIVDRSGTWEPIPTAPEAAVWYSSADPQSIPVRVTGSLRQESQRYAIETAFHDVRFDGSGASLTYSEFHMRTPPARIALTIPVRAEQIQFDWNGRPLSEASGDLRTDPSLPGRYLIELKPGDLVGEGRLRLAYREPARAGDGWRLVARRTVELPQFPPNVWITRSVCEIDLPRDNHLLQSPAALTPEFVWARQGVIWARVPSSRYLDGRARLVTTGGAVEGAAAAFQQVDLGPRGYAFSGMGPIEKVSFTSMNRTLIVLIGAGLSLVLGFLFWRLPWTRNAQTFLIVGFSVSLLSLWFLEPIQVLLQPAILGGVLAVLASLIDTRSRAPEWEEVSSSPVRLPPPGSTGSRELRSGTGSLMAPTAVYQATSSRE